MSTSTPIRSLFLFAIGCLLAALGEAQSASPRVGRIRTPIRNGGTLHLASGRWTHPEQDSAEAADTPGATVFNNDAHQPFFVKAGPRRRIADFGRIPAGTSAAPMVGSVDGQSISGFQFAYSTRERRGDFGYVVTFFDEQGPAIHLNGRRVVAKIRLTDLPGAPQAGIQANWKVTVDLRGSEHAFALGRDGEGGGTPARFAWSLVSTNNAHGSGGPILAGDPLGSFGPAAAVGAGTDWSDAPAAPGTGLGTEDGFLVEQRGPQQGAEWITEIPNAPITYGSFHLQLYADSRNALAGSTHIGTTYCDGFSALFEDGFEGVSFDSGDWTTPGGTLGFRNDDPWAGHWYARIGLAGRLIKEISTVGTERVTLRYARRTKHMPPHQSLYVSWYDGVTWHTLEQIRDPEWKAMSWDLPPAAGNNPDFKFRFRNGGGIETHPSAYIDNVRLDRTGAPHIAATGSTSVSDNDVTLLATGLPAGTFGLFFYGPAQAHAPLGNGTRCVGGQPVRRLRPPVQADPSGSVTRTLDLSTGPEFSLITSAAPITMHFQYWHRESGGSNLTDALRIHFVE